ncbi:MAG TPA: mechanosensitive ion channel family protein [Steroidobacteraceae bacterium]|nr:mechanosensitive ion channel family protein [Steroidobacteraceae bacterium]
MNDTVARFGQLSSSVTDLSIRYGPKLFAALVILLVGVYAGRWIARWTARHLARFTLEPPALALLVRAAWALTFGLFLILALENLGVELVPLIAGLSVLGAGVALAAQGVLGNLVAGLTIIFTKPFRVGEYVAVVGVEGVVRTIQLFSTTLDHFDQSRVVIPNRKIVGEILHNYGDIRQVEVVVSVAYDTDVNNALAAVREILAGNPRILKEPIAVVQPARLGEWAVTIAVRPWVRVRDYVMAAGEINSAILDSFRERNIRIPVPQREVRLSGHQEAKS